MIRIQVNGLPGHLFRYTYDDGGDSLEGPFAVLFIPGVVPELPDFGLSPKSWFGGLGPIGGKHAWLVDTEAGRRFYEHFELRGEDIASLRRLFDERRLGWLADQKGLFLECRKGQMVAWFKGAGHRLGAKRLTQLLQAAHCLLLPGAEEGGAGEHRNRLADGR